ncbi:MAG TPA: prephenate dehydrogenase/arogenate dehydrogenase family protein [Nitrospirae bacterium]|nr:prephenate dehydrogenase/arogenate dehydrogenase family protein [Nitrospirota bacterium]
MKTDFKKVSIIGVGLIGGSFALSLRKAGFDGTIYGTGRNQDNLARANRVGIIDKFGSKPAEGVKDADLVLLASPVGQFPQIAEDIKDHLKKGAIVTDVGSVKAEVINKLEPLMPEGVSFVGGHPIAGKECSGADAASADLFNGARYIITPSPDTKQDALEKVTAVWKSFGSVIITMDPDEHDAIFAAVSHLPHVVAYVLINTIIDLHKDQNILHQGGKGLKDMTRIALSPPDLWRDICAYNKENMLKSLELFSSSVSNVENMIKRSDWDNLWKEFQKARNGRQILESD